MLCSIVGFVYPAFKSFETIETKTKGDDVQWLVYWVVFACFSLVETFKDFLLYWIPFYYAFKLAFLLWAMLPQTKGSKFLYDSFLKDFLKKSENRIDAAVAESKKVRIDGLSFLMVFVLFALMLIDRLLSLSPLNLKSAEATASKLAGDAADLAKKAE